MKAIIFDFDGVLVDSFVFHHESIKDFFGVNLSRKVFSDSHLGNVFSSWPRELEKADWDAYEKFIFDKQVNLPIKPEHKQTLISLSEKYDLYLITSGSEKNISLCLENNDVRSLFKCVWGRETDRSKIKKFNRLLKEFDLRPSECLFITDTVGDVKEAQKVNIKTIAVDFGFHDKKTLEKGNPFKIISHLDELDVILSN